jgi:hypothetical protein
MEMPGSLSERIEGTKMERDIPFMLVKLLERLVEHNKSDMIIHILTSFVDSTFFQSLATYISKRKDDIDTSLDRRFQICMSTMKLLNHLLTLYSSRFEIFSLVIDALIAEVTRVKRSLEAWESFEKIEQLDLTFALFMSKQESLAEESRREKLK